MENRNRAGTSWYLFRCKTGGALTWAVICYGIVAVVTGVADILFYMKMEQHMGICPTVSRFLPDHARGGQHCACGQQAWLQLVRE